LVGAGGLMAALAAGGCAAARGPSASAATRRTPMFAYVGCYTSKERNGKGEGVSVYRMDAASGEWTQVQVVKDVVNPSWLTLDHRRRFLYAAHGDGSEATAFAIDTPSGRLVAADPPSVPSRPGAGPGHVDFHPSKPYLYQINELDSTITTFRFDPERGELMPLQVITTLPPSFTGNSATSEIAVAPSGAFVYGSNRGHDSIAIFAVDDATGVLSSVGWESTQGKVPRFFALDPSGTFLYAANQNSDTIVTFRVDASTGRLKPTGQIVRTGSPSSIAFG